VSFHSYLVTEGAEPRELSPAETAQVTRAIYRASRVREPKPGPLEERLVEIEAEIARDLRRVNDQERAEGVRPAVWPVGAFIVG
jgi:hypothetical protein